ncbi:MAG TPA: alpha/beta fold hydrolase [Blastocatellia bacterium]|nr:alpha/beta fold hydrolase [Blastocatellia bacterium]
MPRISVNDVEIYYDVQGKGEPLLFIAGFGVGHWVWFRQVPSLSQQFRTIVFDNRGIGSSGDSQAPYTIEMLADDAAALIEGLGYGSAHIVGASMGGFIAQELALRHPACVRSLVLACTSFGGPNHVPASPEVLKFFLSPADINSEERIRQGQEIAFTREFIAAHPDVVEMVIQLRLTHPVSEETFRRQVQAVMSFNAEDRVARITAPTLVITAAEDVLIPPENSRRLAARIPGARLTIFERGGHAFFIERAEAFNRAVADFISDVSRQHPM